MTTELDCTHDTLFSGRLHCVQHSEGYRFSVDAVLLAHFVKPKATARILDLCAGSGVVSLIMAYRRPGITLTALEVQPRMVELIRRNITLNHLSQRLKAVAGDLNRIASFVAPGSFDWVVCNPPYRKQETGRYNHGPEQAVARHEIMTDLAGVVRAVCFALKTRGRAAFVYPAERSAVLLAQLKNNGLEPKRLQVVHSYPGGAGKLVMVEIVKGGGEELTILPPFYVYQEPGGAYSEAMARCYAE